MYIVGIDIAKRFHKAAIIDQADKVIVKRIRFANSYAGFLKLMDAVRKLDASVRHGSNRALLVAIVRSLTSRRKKCSRDKSSAVRRLAQHVYPPDQEQHH